MLEEIWRTIRARHGQIPAVVIIIASGTDGKQAVFGHHAPGRWYAGNEQRAEIADEETTLIVGNLTYAGTGWKTSGDALLASTAADQARKRRETGNDELTDRYNSTADRQAA